MQRVSVVGNSGSGKTTLARALSARLRVPHLELDAMYHQAGWTPLSEAEFRARVGAFCAGPGWVVDGNYSMVRDIVWGRADTVVWLDWSRARVMRRILGRTLSRAAGRAELWNGNRERWRDVFSRDPEKSIVVWAWTQHRSYRERYAAAALDPAYGQLRFVRIRTTAELDLLLSG